MKECCFEVVHYVVNVVGRGSGEEDCHTKLNKIRQNMSFDILVAYIGGYLLFA